MMWKKVLNGCVQSPSALVQEHDVKTNSSRIQQTSPTTSSSGGQSLKEEPQRASASLTAIQEDAAVDATTATTTTATTTTAVADPLLETLMLLNQQYLVSIHDEHDLSDPQLQETLLLYKNMRRILSAKTRGDIAARTNTTTIGGSSDRGRSSRRGRQQQRGPSSSSPKQPRFPVNTSRSPLRGNGKKSPRSNAKELTTTTTTKKDTPTKTTGSMDASLTGSTTSSRTKRKKKKVKKKASQVAPSSSSSKNTNNANNTNNTNSNTNNSATNNTTTNNINANKHKSIERKQSNKTLQALEFVMQSPEALKALLETSKEYVPAEVYLFASCDEGEREYKSYDPQGVGLFTSTMLRLAQDIKLQQQQQQNQDILLQLSKLLRNQLYQAHPVFAASRSDAATRPFRIFPPYTTTGTCKALIIGILYQGQKGELQASHQNVRTVLSYLKDFEGLEEEQINVLMDDEDHVAPTKINIVKAFRKLVQEAKPGDALFFYFTGHGGQVTDEDGDEEDGLDEAILPLDVLKAGPLIDDDIFRELISPLSQGVKMTCLIDASHSGAMLELPFKFTSSSSSSSSAAAAALLPSSPASSPAAPTTTRTSSQGITAHKGRFTRMDSARKIRQREVESYIPANICLFASCDEGEEVGNTTANSSTATNVDDGCIFTKTILELSEKVHQQEMDGSSSTPTTKVTNQDVLLRLAKRVAGKRSHGHPVLSSSRPDVKTDEFSLFPTECTGTRMALVIGIQYTGQEEQVLTAHEDAFRVVNHLRNKEGVEEYNLITLVDTDENDKKSNVNTDKNGDYQESFKHEEMLDTLVQQEQPTKENINAALDNLALTSQPGDALFLYFAGRGKQFVDEEGLELDGMNESILPCDEKENGAIMDYDLFRHFVRKIPHGVSLTCVFNASHSGTILDLPFKFSIAQGRRREIVEHEGIFTRMKDVKGYSKNNRRSTIKYNNQLFPRHSLTTPSPEERQHEIADDELMMRAKEYVPAEVYLYAACDVGEHDYTTEENEDDDNNGDENNNEKEKDENKTFQEFQLPDASRQGFGMFTATMLKILKMEGEKMNNQELLLSLSQSLSGKGYSAHPILTSSRPDARFKPFHIFPRDAPTDRRKAILIGIQYKNEKGELPSSGNDVQSVLNHLKTVENLSDDQISILLDDDEHEHPTKQNIIQAFTKLAKSSEAGDAIFCYFTGHGGQVVNDDGDEEAELDTVILPLDVMNAGPLRDRDMFRRFICPMPKGVTITCMFDSSHSGSILRLPFKFSTSRGLRKEVVSHEGNFSLLSQARALRQKEERYSEFWDPLEKLDDWEKVLHINDVASRYVQADVKLFSGCDDGEQVKDMRNLDKYFEIPDAGGRPGGLFTGAMIETLTKVESDPSMTNRDALNRLRSTLAEKGFEQRPLLSSSRITVMGEKFGIIPDGCTGTFRAILIGICYRGESNELQGSHNDVGLQFMYLKEHGFKPENVTILMDDGRRIPPLRKNILTAFKYLVDMSKPGDVAYVHYSGHGGQLEDLYGDEADGYDETIVPLDVKSSGPIRDDTIFEKLVAPMAKGVTLTCVFDCCNSGTILDLPFEFHPETTPSDLIQPKPHFFPHMALVNSMRDQKH